MGLGWGTFAGGIGKILDKLPIQGRKERWKNELDDLNIKRSLLLGQKADAGKVKRLIEIDSRIAYLNQLLKNSATD